MNKLSLIDWVAMVEWSIKKIKRDRDRLMVHNISTCPKQSKSKKLTKNLTKHLIGKI